MDITIVQEEDGVKDFSQVKPDDVVILPAFGASVSEMRMMNDMRVQIVDTTCPWVCSLLMIDADQCLRIASAIKWPACPCLAGMTCCRMHGAHG